MASSAPSSLVPPATLRNLQDIVQSVSQSVSGLGVIAALAASLCGRDRPWFAMLCLDRRLLPLYCVTSNKQARSAQSPPWR